MDEQTVELREVVGVLWRRKLIIIGIALATTVAALSMSFSQTPVYQASTKLVLLPTVSPAALGASSTRAAGIELSAESEAQIIASPVIAERVKESLELGETAQDLVSAVKVRLRTDELMQVTVSAMNPAKAAQIADSFAEEYITYRLERASAALGDRASHLQSRIAALASTVGEADARIVELSAERAEAVGRGGRAVSARGSELQAEIDRITTERNENLAQIASLRTRLDDARNAEATALGGGEIIQAATQPVAPTIPTTRRDGLLGIIFGLLIGIGIGYLREYFDDRIRHEHDAKRVGGAMVGGIPRSAAWRRRKTPFLATLSDTGSPTAESYRAMRQSLVAIGLGKTIRTVHVTSGGPGAGKTATVGNLGVVCAQAGMRVVLVSADLRKPRLHGFFSLSNQIGLSQVLAGDAAVKDCLVQTAIPGLLALPSGPSTRSPAKLLDGVHLDNVFNELLEIVDVVLVDSPPISAGADAMVLASRGDLSLLVMRRGSARASGTTAALNLLSGAGAMRTATVLNLAERPIRRLYGLVEPLAAPLDHANGHDTPPTSPANGSEVPVESPPPAVRNGHAAKSPRASGSPRTQKARSVTGKSRTTRTRKGTKAADDSRQ